MLERAPGKLTRQQIYDRIRQSSKDEYILEEMTRLGFWPKEADIPSPPAALLKRQGELERELRELLSTKRMVEDPEAALKSMRKQRMAESRKNREENKINRIKAAHARSIAWHERRSKEILYLGPDVSKGLNQTDNKSTRLARHHLPDLPDALSLARAMGIELVELRFLAYTRPTSTISHYKRFEIAKKTGGTRLISAPMPRLKRSQYWILENILSKITLPETAHGFIPQRSIVTNARPHTGAALVINLDLENFFPTITYPRIKGMFHAMGYSEQVAVLLALICSEPEVDAIELDNVPYYVGHGPRHLPQGAPTSPAISNIICCRLDRRLAGMSRKLAYRYSRYADDLTFSGDNSASADLQKLLWRARQIIRDEGFILNETKTRIMKTGGRQEVTGIVVNRKPSINRSKVKRFRALLYQLEKDGPEGKTWGCGNDLFASIQGFANLLKMVDPDKGQKYAVRVKRILKKYNYRNAGSPLQPLSKTNFRHNAAAGRPPRDNWWQVEQKQAPELILPREKESKKGPKKITSEEPAATPSAAEETLQEQSPKAPVFQYFIYAVAIFGVLIAFGLIPAMAAAFIILYFSLHRNR